MVTSVPSTVCYLIHSVYLAPVNCFALIIIISLLVRCPALYPSTKIRSIMFHTLYNKHVLCLPLATLVTVTWIALRVINKRLYFYNLINELILYSFLNAHKKRNENFNMLFCSLCIRERISYFH